MAKNLRILVVSLSYPPYTSGVGTVASSLTHAMRDKGHKVGVISSSPTKEPYTKTVDGIEEFRLRSSENPFRKNYFVPSLLPGAVKMIFDDFKPNLVHLHDVSHTSLEMTTVAKGRVPVLYTHHFIPRFVGRQFVGEGDAYIRKILAKGVEKALTKYIAFFANRSDYMTTPTATIKRYLKGFGVKTRISPISNGIDSSKFKPRDFTKKDKLPLVLYFGRLDNDKSLEVLIEAAKYITVPYKMVLAGSGQELPKLKAQAEKLKVLENIEFAGFVKEERKAELFKTANVFAIPSTVEAQSIVTMEAMSSGIPVIAADASALPELVHDGKNGYLFKPGNAKEMGEKITEILKSQTLQKKFGSEGLNIIKNHDIKKTFNIYEKLYLELVEGKYKDLNWRFNYGDSKARA